MTREFSHLLGDLERLEQRRREQAELFDPANFSIKEKSDRVEKARTDQLYFCKEYFPDIFDRPFGRVHTELLFIYNRREHEVHNVQGFRSLGKSALLRYGARIHGMIFKRFQHGVRIAENDTIARREIKATMLEFELNPRLRYDFGDLCGTDYWSMDMMQLKTGVSMQAGTPNIIGRGSLPRKDWAEIDDFEDQESARNPERGRYKLDWLKSELYLALTRDSNIVWLANNLSLDSACNQFKEECNAEPKSKFHYHVYPALVDDGEGHMVSGWPEGWSVDELQQIRETIGMVAFEAEMQQNPMRPGEMFKAEWIQWVEMSDIERDKGLRRAGMMLDPSYGESDAACYKAWVVASTNGKYFDVMDVWLRQSSVRSMFHAGFELFKRWRGWNLIVCKWETTMSNKLMRGDFVNVCNERGENMPLGGYEDKTPKPIRIESLSMPLETGLIRFARQSGKTSQDMMRLVEQITNYPKGANDGPDALAMLYGELMKFYRRPKRPVYESILKRVHRWRD